MNFDSGIDTNDYMAQSERKEVKQFSLETKTHRV